MIARFIQTIYCDDIRHEVNGKLSYIGVYRSVLYVTTFPTTLPKFCISNIVTTPIQRPFKKLNLRIRKDDEVLFEMPISEDKLDEAMQDSNASDLAQHGPERCLSFNFMTAFAPMQFDGPCVLRVRAQTEGKEVCGIALRVEQSPSVQT